MSLRELQNINAQSNLKISNEKETAKSGEFTSLLKEYIDKTTISTEKPSTSNTSNKLDAIANSTNYEAYNRLKVNHLNLDNSTFINKISEENSKIREDKIAIAKKRIEKGFYLRDDIVDSTAGKIIDEVFNS